MFTTAGAQIIEVVNMEEIAAEKQYEFAFLGFPLKLRGATGAPMPSYAVPLEGLAPFAVPGTCQARAWHPGVSYSNTSSGSRAETSGYGTSTTSEMRRSTQAEQSA